MAPLRVSVGQFWEFFGPIFGCVSGLIMRVADFRRSSFGYFWSPKFLENSVLPMHLQIVLIRRVHTSALQPTKQDTRRNASTQQQTNRNFPVAVVHFIVDFAVAGGIRVLCLPRGRDDDEGGLGSMAHFLRPRDLPHGHLHCRHRPGQVRLRLHRLPELSVCHQLHRDRHPHVWRRCLLGCHPSVKILASD